MMTKNVALAFVASALLPSASVGFVPPTTRSQLQEQTQVRAFARNSRIFMSDNDDVSDE